MLCLLFGISQTAALELFLRFSFTLFDNDRSQTRHRAPPCVRREWRSLNGQIRTKSSFASLMLLVPLNYGVQWEPGFAIADPLEDDHPLTAPSCLRRIFSLEGRTRSSEVRGLTRLRARYGMPSPDLRQSQEAEADRSLKSLTAW